jgi:hypothetical protein
LAGSSSIGAMGAAGLPKRDGVHERCALHAGRLAHAFGEQLVELFGLHRVVLLEARVEAGDQQMVFGETGVFLVREGE